MYRKWINGDLGKKSGGSSKRIFRAESRAFSDGPAVLTSLHAYLNCHININIIYLQPRQGYSFTFMNVAFLVLGYMFALITIFCFTFVRVFQVATM